MSGSVVEALEQVCYLGELMDKNGRVEEFEEDQLSSLDNDCLSLILEFTDYASCVRFSKCLSHKWRLRCEILLSGSLGQRIYARLGFSPEDLSFPQGQEQRGNIPLDRWQFGRFDQECQLRRMLDQAVSSSNKRCLQKNFWEQQRSCFAFAPVLRDDTNVIRRLHDTPTLSFSCDSFWFSSSGISGELLFLNPLTACLAVWDDVLHHTTAFHSKTTTTDSRHGGKSSSPRQILFDPSHDYFRLQDYFPQFNHGRHHNNNQNQPQFDLAFVGVEAKPILKKLNSGSIQPLGTMVAMGRVLSRDDQPPHGDIFHPRTNRNNNDSYHCVTELLSWFRNADQQLYGNQHVCRFRGGFRTLDVCANQRCVYVNPWTLVGVETFANSYNLDQMAQEQVIVYPMIRKNDERTCHSPNEQQQQLHFPLPVAAFSCKEAVTALKVSALGDVVVVATVRGKVQIWNMTNFKSPNLVMTLSCFDGLRDACQRLGRWTLSPNLFSQQENMVGREPTGLPSHPVAVEEVFLSRHLTIEQAGFVTLQHTNSHDNTLLLWKLVEKQWRVQASVHLPIFSTRYPKIHFDGRKIIVLGEDHIGCLLLIYQVFYSNDDLPQFEAIKTVSPGTALSGGVVNFSTTPQIRYVDRIRHGALGGLLPFESLYMTCNERFIVVATKKGELASHLVNGVENGSCFHNEGLLVIDLLQLVHPKMSSQAFENQVATL